MFVLGPQTGRAQEPSILSLSLAPSSARLTTAFSDIVSVTELNDGRVVIADRRERRVVVADLSTSTASSIGRVGQGPGEYTNVTTIWPLGGDSSMMADVQTRRWLIFQGSEITRTVPLNAPAIVATRGLVVGADARGFLLTRGQTPLAEAAVRTDSIALIKVGAESATMDTIAKLGPRATRTELEFDGGPRPSAIRFSTPVLKVEEQAVLFQDGWLAIARLQPYRVDWRRPDGTWIYGRPLPFREIPIDDREKQAHREWRTSVGLNPVSDAADWAVMVPPFLPAAPYEPLLAAPDGSLLIARPPTADLREISYDVIDRGGTLVSRLVLRSGERVASIGRRGVYVVTTDPYGLQRVSRHPWPPS